ncbi:histidine kinase, partial [Psychrosphaera haliotis]|nr:histidine kinase [Psychrosphaera haliotis]
MQTLFCLLPVLAAVLIESHIRFMTFHSQSASDIIGIFLQLSIETLPLYLSHVLICQKNDLKSGYLIKLKRHSMLFWLVGFIIYPAFLLSFGSQPFSNFTIFQTPLFSVQGWLIAMVFSVIWILTLQRQKATSSKFSKWLSWCFSLNALVSLGIIVWAVIMAGVLNSNENPMENQPLTPLIDIGVNLNSPMQFIFYLWQFLFLGGLVGSIYLMNRYWFIRRFLAEHGVLAFLMVSICCLVIVTPLFSYLGLLIPLNQYEFTLIPSADHNPFEITNYHFMVIVLAISTPVILAFERQQQQLNLSKIESSKRLTELKLLQQQINPHFLFNTLNNLYALTLAKSEKSPDMVMQLSNLLRYTVYEGQNDTVKVKQEVEYLKDFIALQKIRLSDETLLSVQWPFENQDSKSDSQSVIPPLLLINIVENAFKYAGKGASNKSIINIKLSC